MKFLLWLAVFLFFTLAGNSLHAEKIVLVAAKGTSGHEQEKKSAQKETYDAHRSYTRFHFEDDEMDFAFQWVLGSIPNGGGEIGEAFYVAGNIEDGNPESWQNEWEKMARRKEVRAKGALENGHKITARENYLKASNYYRTALVSMLPDNLKFNGIAEKIRTSMKEACKLFDPPMTYFEVPFEKTVLPGYFRPVKNDGKPRRTLLMIGGGETFIEDLVFYIEPQAIKRGYNFITVDLPGQGMLPAEGQFFRKDTETPMKAILDVILKFPEVEAEKLAVYGISNGGYFVPRAATVDKRIRAVVISSAVVDNYLMFKEMPFSKDTQEQIDQWPAFKKAVTSAVTWRWGLDPKNVKGQVEVNKDYQFDPAKVTCPVLDLVGAGEYVNKETERQQEEFMNKVGTKNKTLVITPENEGASSHCIGENRTLMAQVVFDWLDDLFGHNRKK
jgi:alpha-beta hydrolase superfamily lysophospholipase